MRAVHDLPPEECARLIGTSTSGRVAVCTPSGPHIVPVAHAIDGRSVLFRTTPHSVVGTYGRGTVLCFETGRLDDEQAVGWSVVVRGRADVVDDAGELARIADAVPHPTRGLVRTLVVRIPWTEVTGRTFVAPVDPGSAGP